ncbi:KIF-binding protein-like [Prorops nasuta]|uniref:KIF-binding protein-like n=1 Tax=Prorops nasuta TaxID=863751 RepID=UPI0034CF3F53
MGSNNLDSEMEDIKKKFVEIKKLLEEQEPFDNEKEPYKSKYAAIKVFKEIQLKLDDLVNATSEKKDDLIKMLAVVHLNLGILHTDTEELKAGEEQFMSCLNLLKGKEMDVDCIIATLSALNQLGIVWSHWSQPAKAKNFLDQAENLYKQFTDSTNSNQDPINMSKLFGIEDDELSPTEVLHKLHTLTLYYLAQIYGTLKDHHKSAQYCHMTLRRQLGDGSLQNLDHIDWALNAATLSQYFMENEGFPQARHHLAAASYLLQKYQESLEAKGGEDSNEAIAAEWETFRHRKADVARCWAKYGILLLSMSKQRLLQKAENESESKKENSEKVTEKGNMNDLKFDVLEKDIEAIAEQITDKFLLDFNDARPVFLNTQKWLDDSKKYYSFDSHASDYVQIAQDLSQAFKYLSFFEESDDRQAKMHKRRVDILENVVKELSPQYYQDACRQIWIELGETYSDILDIKLDRFRTTDERPSAIALAKVNNLIKNAIRNFQLFLNSLKPEVTANGVEQFSEDVLQPALCAYFNLGRLYNKFITPDKSLQLENTINGINAYKFIVDYCDKNPNAAEIMRTELNICRELASLLPLKVQKLRQELTGS